MSTEAVNDDAREDGRLVLERLRAADVRPLLGIDDLAAALGVSRREVERLRAAGRVPAPDRRIGKLLRWKPETVRAWLEEGGDL